MPRKYSPCIRKVERYYNVKANEEKCKFLLPEIQYLGYKLSKEGIKPTKDKLKAIKDASPLQTYHL